jgi:alpha-1,4-digalacturonate transport system permease protein
MKALETRVAGIMQMLFKPIVWLLEAFDGLISRLEKLIGSKRMPYFFVLPNLLIFGTFILLPMLLNFAYAFTGGENFRLDNRPSVGWTNFNELLTCQDYSNVNTCEQDLFWRAARNSGLYVILEVPSMLIVSLMIAVALNQRIMLRGMFRSIFFYPVLLSPVVIGIIWKWVLQNRTGLLNTLIQSLGGTNINFITEPQWALFWVIFVSVWAQTGFYTLILLAGLQSIPPSLYEAAQIDGSNARQSFLHITLPLLRPTILVVLVLSLIRSVQAFDIVYVLTGGGPGTATTMLVQYIFTTGFGKNNFGLAAAASLILAITLASLTLMQLFFNRRQTEAT